METTVGLVMAAVGLILIAALHLTHLKPGEEMLGGWFVVMLVGLFLIGLGAKELGYQKCIREKGGIPLKVSQLVPGKPYRAVNFLSEYNLLLVRDGETGFRTVIDPEKKLQGGEAFEVDDSGEIKITKSSK